jgi:hypothetical protein
VQCSCLFFFLLFAGGITRNKKTHLISTSGCHFLDGCLATRLLYKGAIFFDTFKLMSPRLRNSHYSELLGLFVFMCHILSFLIYENENIHYSSKSIMFSTILQSYLIKIPIIFCQSAIVISTKLFSFKEKFQTH